MSPTFNVFNNVTSLSTPAEADLKAKRLGLSLSVPKSVHRHVLSGVPLACSDPEVKGQGHTVIKCAASVTLHVKVTMLIF